MKLEFGMIGGAAARAAGRPWTVAGESHRLTDVMLSAPTFLEPVPCCSVTRERLAGGFVTDRAAALAQHDRLRATLEAAGVAVHMVPAAAGLADLCFTRDAAVTTPWGLLGLAPALPHRREETDRTLAAAGRLGIRPFARIEAGTVEGGDVCVARPGLLILGVSGERTDAAGAETLGGLFRTRGWEVLICPFDPYFLHLDTLFCMIDERHALACVDDLDPRFLDALAARGIAVLPVTGAEGRGLGCNILSLDGRRIVMAAGHSRVRALLEDAGFVPIEVEVSQFTACGGGIHCLTMPLRRVASAAR